MNLKDCYQLTITGVICVDREPRIRLKNLLLGLDVQMTPFEYHVVCQIGSTTSTRNVIEQIAVDADREELFAAAVTLTTGFKSASEIRTCTRQLPDLFSEIAQSGIQDVIDKVCDLPRT